MEVLLVIRDVSVIYLFPRWLSYDFPFHSNSMYAARLDTLSGWLFCRAL